MTHPGTHPNNQVAGAHARPGRQVAFTDLALAECQALLKSRTIGRIAWNAASSPQILPISYGCDQGLLFFRTSPFGVLSELVRPTQVVLEVDDLDLIRHTGWSVIVHGRAQAIAAPAIVDHLWTVHGAEPWAAGTRNVFIGITPELVTGRRFSSRCNG